MNPFFHRIVRFVAQVPLAQVQRVVAELLGAWAWVTSVGNQLREGTPPKPRRQDPFLAITELVAKPVDVIGSATMPKTAISSLPSTTRWLAQSQVGLVM